MGEKVKVMGPARSTRSQYFQTIARYFFHYRGAPFFLSSKDLDIIARWERMKIPLRVVLEGMKKAFEVFPSKRGEKGKVFSLAFCQRQVLQAFERHKERRIGKESLLPGKEEKRKKAKAEVEKFLKHIHPRVRFLRRLYSQALEVLSGQNIEEEELERMEERIESLLVEKSSDEEVEEAKRTTRKEYASTSEDEFLSIWRMKLVRRFRERHQIPYISLYYY